MSQGTIESYEDIAEGLDHLTQCCVTMAKIIPNISHVPLRRRAPNFASLASIIIAQQVSKSSAEAIFGRMENLIQPLTAENYLAEGEAAWIKIGLSRPKQRTFMALCQAMVDERFCLDELAEMPAVEAIAAMTAIKGIGPWTAEVYLLSAIGHKDIFPAGDLALQLAATHAYGHESKMSEKELRVLAESWAPWRSVAARILWAHYAIQNSRTAIP